MAKTIRAEGLGGPRYKAMKRTKREPTKPNRPRRKVYRGQGRR